MRKLRRIRAEKGLTMDALEERTGVSKRTISEIERGMRTPQTLTLAKLANALEVDLDDLLEEEVPKAQAPLPLNLAAAGPEDEETQRRFLPYVRPWFELWKNLSERWEAAAESGTLSVGAAQEAGETQKNVMAAMNMVLEQLASEGIDTQTGPIYDGLRDAMLRLASAQEATGDIILRHLSESQLEQARKQSRKRKTEQPQTEADAAAEGA